MMLTFMCFRSTYGTIMLKKKRIPLCLLAITTFVLDTFLLLKYECYITCLLLVKGNVFPSSLSNFFCQDKQFSSSLCTYRFGNEMMAHIECIILNNKLSVHSEWPLSGTMCNILIWLGPELELSCV